MPTVCQEMSKSQGSLRKIRIYSGRSCSRMLAIALMNRVSSCPTVQLTTHGTSRLARPTISITLDDDWTWACRIRKAWTGELPRPDVAQDESTEALRWR